MWRRRGGGEEQLAEHGGRPSAEQLELSVAVIRVAARYRRVRYAPINSQIIKVMG